MRGSFTLVLVAALLVAVAATFAPAATSWAQAGGEIVLGTLWPLSGTAAPWGNDNLKGAKVAVQIINERGGINGKKVRLVDADNASNLADYAYVLEHGRTTREGPAAELATDRAVQVAYMGV